MSDLEGILVLNKPTGITSAKALYRVRSITRQRKSGHAGTLDPGASGVLLICLGRSTKLVESLMNLPKVYRATARLDITSESFDSDSEVRVLTGLAAPTDDRVIEVVRTFEGDIEQVPPRVSALKVGGRPAYRLARSGQEFDLPARTVHVYWMHVYSYRWPVLDFEVCCGRGTYIRALIRDIGERLGTGGCLTSLVRRCIGPFRIEDSWTPDRLGALHDPIEAIIRPETMAGMIQTSVLPERPEPNQT